MDILHASAIGVSRALMGSRVAVGATTANQVHVYLMD